MSSIGGSSGKAEPLGFLGACLSVYLVAAPLDFVEVVPGVSLARIAALPLILAILLSLGRLRLELDGFLLAVGAYVLVMLLSLGVSANLESGLVHFASIAVNLIFVVVLSSFDYSDTDRRWLARSLMVGAWIVVAIMVMSPGNVTATVVTGRVVANLMGNQPDPNELCQWFVYPSAMYMYRFLRHRAPLNLVACLVFVVAGVFTGSRGGVGGILAGLVVTIVCYLHFERNSWRLVILSLLSIPVFYVAYRFVIRRLPLDVLARFTVDNPDMYSAELRLAIWRQLLLRYGDSPLVNQAIGHGPNATRELGGYDAVAHNTPLENLLDFGVAGLVSYTFLMLAVLRMAWKSRSAPLVGSLAGIGVVLLSISGLADKPLYSVVLLVILGFRVWRRTPEITRGAPSS